MKKWVVYFVLIVFYGTFAGKMQAAESVGSFNITMLFNGENRTVSCYVPTDYNNTKQYSLLIGLHGAGDNSVNYRDYVMQAIKWDTLFKNTIFIFPDGGSDQAKDFYSPAGDEKIIDTVKKWTTEHYNIMADSIYLSGFSLGGRSALRYGLDFPEEFAGLLLFTPAVQCPMDVQNKPGFSLMFNYNNANKIPIAISHGDADMGFIKVVKMLSDSLVQHNSHLMYVLIPGMGHSITPNQITESMFKFLNTPITKATPVIHSLKGDLVYYDGKAALKCRVTNMGETPVTSLTFEYKIDGAVKTVDGTGSLTKGNYIDYVLPESDLEDGFHTASISITKCNGEIMNPNQYFNLGEYSFNVWKNALPIPFTEDFTSENNIFKNFAVKESGNFITWSFENTIGKDGDGAMSMLNSQLAYLNYGLIESMYSNKIDYSAAEKPYLSFDLAFNYTYYLPPHVQSKTDFTDTLQIFISNDNWKTSTSIFKKWGEDLRTYSAPLENPLSLQAFLVEPTANDWKNIELDLKDYNVNAQTMFRFDYISGMGGIIIIDNFKAFDKAAVSVSDMKESAFSIYPNPANSNETIVMTLNSPVTGDLRIELFNGLGQKVSDLTHGNIYSGENSFAVALPALSSGMYILKAKVNNTEIIKNIIIQ